MTWGVLAHGECGVMLGCLGIHSKWILTLLGSVYGKPRNDTISRFLTAIRIQGGEIVEFLGLRAPEVGVGDLVCVVECFEVRRVTTCDREAVTKTSSVVQTAPEMTRCSAVCRHAKLAQKSM